MRRLRALCTAPLALPLLTAITTPAAALIAFQARRDVDLGGEATAAAFGGTPGRVLVATPDGIATLRYDEGTVVRGERSGEGRSARILVASGDLAVFTTREAPKISIARLGARGVPEMPVDVDLPAVPRAARVLALNGGVPAVAVLHDGGLSVLTGGAHGWTRRDMAAPRFAADLAAIDYDADGHADIVLADQTSGVLSLLRGSGDGTFETGGTRPTARGPQRVIAADATGDQRPDLLVIGDDGLYLHRVTADGRLSPPQLVWPSAHVSDVAGRRSQRRRRPDLAISDRSAGTTVMMIGSPDGSLERRRLPGRRRTRNGAGGRRGRRRYRGRERVRPTWRRATWLHGRGDGTFEAFPARSDRSAP
jgi:hypothetical protein